MKIFEHQRASIEHPNRLEDATLVISGNGKAPVFAVIDGMGGHHHVAEDGQIVTGQDAARLISKVLHEDLANIPADIPANGEAEKCVLAALDHAHQRVYQDLNHGEALPLRKRIGAVVTVGVVCDSGKSLFVAQVGDSRAYLFSGDHLMQLSTDEDNIELLVRQRGITEDDAARITAVLNDYDGVNEPVATGMITLNGAAYELNRAWRWFLVGNAALSIFPSNIVINSLGAEAEHVVAQTVRIDIDRGDTLMVCSDGLHKNLSDAEIIAKLNGSVDPAFKLVEAAYRRSQDHLNKRMSPDDISVIVVRF